MKDPFKIEPKTVPLTLNEKAEIAFQKLPSEGIDINNANHRKEVKKAMQELGLDLKNEEHWKNLIDDLKNPSGKVSLRVTFAFSLS